MVQRKRWSLAFGFRLLKAAFPRVTVNCDSKSSQIEKASFSASGWNAIHLPLTVELLCEKGLSVRTGISSPSIQSRDSGPITALLPLLSC